MDSLTKLMEVGKDLGLEGAVLLDFIKEREKAEKEKEEKRVAREEKKEAERLAREAEKEEKDLKLQLDKLAREERMKDREYKQRQ